MIYIFIFLADKNISYFEFKVNKEISDRAVNFLRSGCTIISSLSTHESSSSPNNCSGYLRKIKW